MWTAQQHYSCSVASVGEARTFCTEQLSDLLGQTSAAQDVVDAANLIVSELITNAVNAECSSSNLTLTCEGEFLRISVLDDGPGSPVLTAAAERDEHGRGLAIIDALAASWGVIDYEDDGKQVWAELSIPFCNA
jgi:anti-sigma regulatory factor (Ser/Thr protein kinase)